MKLDLNSRFDLHMHTYYCDGKDSPEEMVLAAIELGLDAVGISGHAWNRLEYPYCMTPFNTGKYIDDIGKLKLEYADKINVLLGTEKGYGSHIDAGRYDYVIGAVHCMKKGRHTVTVDASADELRTAAGRFFGGDMMSLAEAYYEHVAKIVEYSDCDIIAHFDLITKFAEREPYLLDTNDPRYVNAWKAAVDMIFEQSARRENRIFETGGMPVFEINTGAITRGYRTTPYPAKEQIEYIKSKGGILIKSSDSHQKENVGYEI